MLLHRQETMQPYIPWGEYLPLPPPLQVRTQKDHTKFNIHVICMYSCIILTSKLRQKSKQNNIFMRKRCREKQPKCIVALFSLCIQSIATTTSLSPVFSCQIVWFQKSQNLTFSSSLPLQNLPYYPRH